MIRGHKTYKEPEKISPSYIWYYTIWKQQNLKQYETGNCAE